MAAAPGLSQIRSLHHLDPQADEARAMSFSSLDWLETMNLVPLPTPGILARTL